MSFWERYARVGLLRASTIGFIALALAVVAALSLDRLRLDTRLEALLPPDTRMQHALAELRERASSDADFTVLITSSEPALNRRLAGRIAQEMHGWEEVRWVTDRREGAAMVERAALYLPTKTLRTLADDLQARVDWEYCERMPGCVNLFDQPQLPGQRQLMDALSGTPTGRALAAYLGQDPAEWWSAKDVDDQGGKATDSGMLCAEDGSVCAVQAALRGSASDLTYARRMLSKAEKLFQAVRPPNAPRSLRMVVSGRYRNAPMERAAIGHDLRRITLVSSGLILALLLLQFRGLRALLLLIVPLSVAVLATLGALAWLHPRLNLISAFTLAILAGIGVDFGIHLLTHYGEERSHGNPPQVALGATLRGLFTSMVAAAVTTGCAFAALSASDFRGIAEMGWMAGMGVILSLTAFLLLFPVATVVAHRLVPERAAPLRVLWLRGLPAPSARTARMVALAGLAAGVVGAAWGTEIELETDFRSLRQPGVSHGIPSREALQGAGGLSVYVMAEGAAQLTEAADDLLERAFDGVAGEGRVVLLAPSVLLPREQPTRLDSLRDIRAATDRLAKHAQGDTATELRELRQWADVAAPLNADDLPARVRESLTERDGAFGRLGVIYLPLRGYDANAMEALGEQLEVWQQRYPGVSFASPSVMLGEVVPALRADAWTIVGLALLGLTVASVVLGRSLGRAALVLAPVLLAMACSAGVMVGTDLHINLYNILVLPVAFGIGIDGAVYIVWSTAHAPDRAAFWKRLRLSAQAVLGSSLTSLAAFGSIALASNPGLSSLGKLAILTIALGLAANLIWLPCWLLWRRDAAGG